MHIVSMALKVVLAASKVPHKVADIHKIDLVTQEVSEVFAKRRKAFAVTSNFGIGAIVFIVTRPLGIELFVQASTRAISVVHAREKCGLGISGNCSLANTGITFIIFLFDAISTIVGFDPGFGVCFFSKRFHFNVVFNDHKTTDIIRREVFPSRAV